MSNNSNLIPLSYKHLQAVSKRMTRAAAKKFGAESGSDPSPSGLDPEGSQANPPGYTLSLKIRKWYHSYIFIFIN